MNIALFGGSFDPPHIAHQMICFYLIEYRGFDRVFLIPTYKHAFGKKLTAFEHRLEMCFLLADPFNDKVTVTGIEEELVEKGGDGSTIDTIKDFKLHFPEDTGTLVIGSDILRELHKWKDFEGIQKLVDVMCFTRDGYPFTESSMVTIEEYFNKPEVSSTRIRALLGKGESVSRFVYPPVLEYIRKHKLYIRVS